VCHHLLLFVWDSSIPVQLVKVFVAGLKQSATLNQQTGRIVGWSKDKGRYEVRIDTADMKMISLLPANTQLSIGVVCRCEPFRVCLSHCRFFLSQNRRIVGGYTTMILFHTVADPILGW
jgi:hypothetical protein